MHHKKQKARHIVRQDQQPGQILLLLLLLVSVALVIALGLIQTSLTQKRTVRYEDSSLRAYYAAEAGLEDAIPRLQQLTHVSGQELDERLENPSYGLTVYTQQTLGEDSRYTYTRQAGRDSVYSIERSIQAEESTEFDLSDTGDVTLENSELEIEWEDETCDEDGNCQTALEAILVWEIPQTENLLYNPGLDFGNPLPFSTSSTKQWIPLNGYGTITEENSIKLNGSSSRKITIATNPGWPVGMTRSLDDLVPVQANTQYTLSVYSLVSDIAGGEFKVDIKVWDDPVAGDGNHFVIDREKSFSKITGTQWERAFVTFTTNATGLFLQPFFHLSDGATGTVYIDQIQLEIQPQPTAYCNGGEGVCAWTGSDIYSTSVRQSYYDMQRFFYDTRPAGQQICDPCFESGCNNLYGRTCGSWDGDDDVGRVYIWIHEPSMKRSFRVKSMFNPVRTYLRARSATWPDVTYKLVGQEIVLTSTGYYEDTVKTVQASHGLPSLMPTFDYVLFNYGCADPLTCFPRDLVK